MEKELVNEFVSKLEANMESIKKVFKENLGIEINTRVVTSGRYDIYVKIEEFESDETTKVLTSHPLLRQMFKKSQIEARAWYDKEENTATFLVHIFYEHNFTGGSNGVELMRFEMNLATGEVIALKK